MILVTGGTGFIGEQLVRRLVAGGQRVRVLARTPAKVAAVFGDLAPGLEVARGDLGDRSSLEAAVAGVRQVYHCASWIAYKGDWDAIWRVNVQGLVNLMDACHDAKVERVVHISSVAAGGPAVRESDGSVRPRTETDPPAPLNDPYGRSKLEQEQVALRYPFTVIVRPSAVYGPGDPTGINTLLKLVSARRLPFFLGARRQVVNMVPVRDVVSGCLAAMERGRPGGVYNLVGPDMTHAELFGLLALVSGGRAPSFEMPVPALLVAAGAVAAVTGLFRTPPLHPNDVRSWTAAWSCSGEKARRELGLEASDPVEAWTETFQWLKQREQRASAGG